ncbi:hypothetical protein ASD31_17410, partial [Rhizobium sp. Root482]
GSLNLLVFIKISSFIKPEKILLLKPVNLRGDYRRGECSMPQRAFRIAFIPLARMGPRMLGK